MDLANRLLASWGVKGLRCHLQNDLDEDGSAWEATLSPIGDEPWLPPPTSFHIRDVIIERIESLLGASPFYASAEQKRLLRMCEPCKSGQRLAEMSTRGETARVTQTQGLKRGLDLFASASDSEPCGSFCGCKLEVRETPRTSSVTACGCAPDVPRPSPATEPPAVYNFDIFSLPVDESAAQSHFDDTRGNRNGKFESGVASTKIIAAEYWACSGDCLLRRSLELPCSIPERF